MKSSSILFLVIFVLISACVSAPPSDPIIELDSHITNAMNTWDVPGLAVVVVKGDSISIKGYGSQVLGTSKPINEETYLQIASNSKMFAAYTIGILVDEGRLDWADPVIEHIPEFKLPDSMVEENITIDDLLSHRSGLTELALGGFQNSNYSIDDLLQELKNTPLSTRFRSQNNYSQVGMALLGEIVHRVSGLSWGEFVHERIFEPLRMEDSYSDNVDFNQQVGNPTDLENIMIPAIRKDGAVLKESWQYVGTEPLYAPAGGIISNMRDMSTWIKFRLDGGKMDGQQLISPEVLLAIRAARIPLDMSALQIYHKYVHPDAELIDVGYGHYCFEHRGRKVITHNGGWMSSVISIIPSEDIGVGVFSNAWYDEPGPWASLAFVNALVLDIFDHYLGYYESDWCNMMEEIVVKDGHNQSIVESPSNH